MGEDRASTRNTLVRYGGALLAVVVATALRRLLDPAIGSQFPLGGYFVALIVVAWYGGLGPSLVALTLSMAAIPLLNHDVRGSFGNWSIAAEVNSWRFFLAGLAVALMGGAMRSAQERAQAVASQVERALKVEQALRERFRATFQSIADGIITTDAQGRVAALNPVAERLTGWTSADAAGRVLAGVFHTVNDETQSTADLPVAEVMREGHSVYTSSRTVLIARDGTSRPIEFSTTSLMDDPGNVTGVVITFRDITERKRTETELRESERQARRLADTMPQIVWTAGVDGAVDYFNARWHEYTGMTAEESLANLGWRSAIHPDDLERLFGVRKEAVAEQRVFEAEVRIRDRAGQYRWHLIRSVPVRDETGAVVRRYGAGTDIDDRKRDEEALQESEEQYRAVYNQAAVGIAEVDMTGRFIRANARFCEIVGHPWPGLHLLRFRDITHPDDLPRNLGLFARTVEEGEPYTIEKRYVRQDGRIVWARTAVALIRDGAGRPLRVAAMTEDITEPKRLEAELQHRMDQLAEADRKKDEFLALLAHELRNPLAPIRNALHLLDRADPDQTTRDEVRAVMRRQVEHITRLVDDLMDVSRITRGKIELRKEVVDLAGVVARAVEANRPQIEDQGHDLHVSLPPEPIRLEADPIRLGQVLDNLLLNAAKYTDPGGRIDLEAVQEGGAVVLQVRDTGIGVAPEKLPGIFDLFWQADRGHDRAQGGLGIGLSLVRSLVELHGGTVAAQSRGLGLGSQFIVRLPASANPNEEGCKPPVNRRALPLALPRRRILVVDDNVDSARTMAQLLKRAWGQEVEIAHDGAAAVEAAATFRPEVILLDIGLPRMSGYDVAKHLRTFPEFASTYIIAMTGWGQEQDRVRSQEAGINHHLVKPVDLDDLQRLLTGLDANGAE